LVLRPIQIAAVSLLACVFSAMVLGAYVKAIGAGMACPEWGTCRDGLVFPMDSAGVAAEVLHRIAVTGIVAAGLVLLFIEFTRYRAERELILTTLGAAGLVGVQIALGAFTISSNLQPVVVTAHQAVAVLIFGVALVIALRIWRLPPEAAAAGAESRALSEPEGAESG